MNNAQFQLNLVEPVNCIYPDGEKLLVRGIGAFEFYDQKEMKSRLLRFKAWGYAAETLASLQGLSTIIATGSLNIQGKPSFPVLNIQSVVVIKSSPIEDSVNEDSSPIEKVNEESLQEDLTDPIEELDSVPY